MGFSGHQHIEGVKIFHAYKEEKRGFETIKLSDTAQWIIGPCIANGKYENGFMVLDTENLELEVLPLHSPKRIMQVVYV